MSLPGGVRLFYGNDGLRMDNEIEALIERVLPDEGTRPFNLERIDGEETRVSQILVLARSLPCCAGAGIPGRRRTQKGAHYR